MMALTLQPLLFCLVELVVASQQSTEGVTVTYVWEQTTDTLVFTLTYDKDQRQNQRVGHVQQSMNESVTGNQDFVTETSTAMQKHPLFNISEKLFLVVFPVITVVGLVGNTLILLVIQRPSQRRSSVSVFMSALAVADSIVLVFDFINNWIHFVSSVHLKSSSLAFCRAYNFIFSTMFTYAAWLVVCVSVERMIVVWWPLEAKTFCTVRKATLTVFTLPILCGALNVYHILIWRLNEDGRCDMDDEYRYFNQNVQAWFSAVFYSYLPIVILVVSNACIIGKLLAARKSRKTMGAEKMETFRVTITVVVICILYIALTVPLTLFYAIIYYLDQFTQRSPQMDLGRTLILILGLSNHAINFFLYALTSAKFRKELRALCYGCRDRMSGSDASLATFFTDPTTAVSTSASTHM